MPCQQQLLWPRSRQWSGDIAACFKQNSEIVTEPGNYSAEQVALVELMLAVDPVTARTGAQLIDDATVKPSGDTSFLWQVW